MALRIRNTVVGRAIVISLFTALVTLGQTKNFDGTWQMDAAKSKLNDARVLTLTITTIENGVKMVVSTHRDAADMASEFHSKLDGKPCEFPEGDHKSQMTVWFDGSSLNASKENGPAGDVTSMWKWELAPDKQTLTLKINHYEPAAADEVVVFTRKS